MSILQELITKFSERKTQELYIKIIRAVQESETLWIAYSENSKNYFLGNESGRAAAYVFSSREYFDKYYDHMKAKGKEVKAAENPVKYRSILFGDLYRAGFDCVVIDNGQHYMSLSLYDIIKKPQIQTKNKKARHIVNPALLRTANFIFQEEKRDRISPDMWQMLFSEVFKAEYIIPADTKELKITDVADGEIEVTKDSRIYFPMLENSDGKKYYPFFTDWNEYRKYDRETQYTIMAAGFKDMSSFVEKGDGIVINPFGVNIIIDNEMLKTIEQAATELKKEKAVISVGDPKEYPLEMVRKISEALWDKEYIKAAYLKLMMRNNDRSYLVALEGELPEKPQELYDEIAESAMPNAENLPIDFIDYSSDFAQKVFKDSRPFYTTEKKEDE